HADGVAAVAHGGRAGRGDRAAHAMERHLHRNLAWQPLQVALAAASAVDDFAASFACAATASSSACCDNWSANPLNSGPFETLSLMRPVVSFRRADTATNAV